MKDNKSKWIIGLLVVILVIQLLTKYPIVIDVRDCPSVVCKDVSVNCNCLCPNETEVKSDCSFKYYKIGGDVTYHNLSVNSQW